MIYNLDGRWPHVYVRIHVETRSKFRSQLALTYRRWIPVGKTETSGLNRFGKIFIHRHSILYELANVREVVYR